MISHFANRLRGGPGNVVVYPKQIGFLLSFGCPNSGKEIHTLALTANSGRRSTYIGLRIRLKRKFRRLKRLSFPIFSHLSFTSNIRFENASTLSAYCNGVLLWMQFLERTSQGWPFHVKKSAFSTYSVLCISSRPKSCPSSLKHLICLQRHHLKDCSRVISQLWTEDLA